MRKVGLEREEPSIKLVGFGANSKETLESLNATLVINEEEFETRCHVVSDGWLLEDILIGKDVIEAATILIKNGKIMFKKTKQGDYEEMFLGRMDVMPLVHEKEMECIETIANKDFREQAKQLVMDYHPEKGTESCVKMKLLLSDETPLYQKPRKLAPAEGTAVSEEISSWLSEGIIQYSNLDFASPIVVVKKKNGTMRLFIDYRKLNTKIIKDR